MCLAIALSPTEAMFYINRSKVYYHQEKYAEVLADLSAAIKLDPKMGNHMLSGVKFTLT